MTTLWVIKQKEVKTLLNFYSSQILNNIKYIYIYACMYVGWMSQDTALQASPESFGNDLKCDHQHPLYPSNPKHHMEDIKESFTLSILCAAGPQSNMPVPWNMAWFHSASSLVLITFPSCSSDPDIARLETGKNNVERCFSSACTNIPGCAETVPAPNSPAGCYNADFSNMYGFV